MCVSGEAITAGLAGWEELEAKLFPKTSVHLRTLERNKIRHKRSGVFGISTTTPLSIITVFITNDLLT